MDVPDVEIQDDYRMSCKEYPIQLRERETKGNKELPAKLESSEY